MNRNAHSQVLTLQDCVFLKYNFVLYFEKENTVEGNMQSQTMINSKDKRFGPKELNIINPIT